MSYFGEFILLFLFVFGIQFKGIPISTSKLVIVFLLIWYILLKKDKKIKIKKALANTLFILIFLLVISLLVVFINGTGDYSIPYSILLFIIEDFFGSLLMFAFLNRNKKANIKHFIDLYIDISTLQSIIIFIMLISSKARLLIWNLLAVDYTDLNSRYDGIRGLGMASSVTYDLGIILSFALIFISYKIIKENYKNTLTNIIKYLLIIIGTVLSGRTGLIGLVISLCILIYGFIKNKKMTNFIKFPFIITISILMMIIAYDYFVPINLRKRISLFVFESWYNYQETGEMSSYTSRNLKKMMIKIPLKTILIGDGYYVDKSTGRYYLGTDIGYLRQIAFWGILPSILLYYMYIYWYKRINKTLIKNNKLLSIVLLFILIYYFIGNFKGDFMLGCRMATKIFLIIFILFSNIQLEKDNKLIKR